MTDHEFLVKCLRGDFTEPLTHYDHLRLGYLLLSSEFKDSAVFMFREIIAVYTEKLRLGKNPFDIDTTVKWFAKIQVAWVLATEIGNYGFTFEDFHRVYGHMLKSDREKLKP